MLVELLALFMLPMLSSCDTARAALGSCGSQLSTSVGADQSFELNLTVETSTPGLDEEKAGSSSTVTTQPEPSTPEAPEADPKPDSTSKPAKSPKPVSSPAPSNTPAPPEVVGCATLDPPLARLYAPPCPPKSSQPKPGSSKPEAAADSGEPATEPPAKTEAPSEQTEVTPPSRSSIPGGSQSQQDTFAAKAPEPRLKISAAPFRVGAAVEFEVVATAVTSAGKLIDQLAEIRFSPIRARLSFGDGQQLDGFRATHSYNAVGWYTVYAVVRYRVDYRIGSGNWVLNAAELESATSATSLQILEPRRRTLLVN